MVLDYFLCRAWHCSYCNLFQNFEQFESSVLIKLFFQQKSVVRKFSKCLYPLDVADCALQYTNIHN